MTSPKKTDEYAVVVNYDAKMYDLALPYPNPRKRPDIEQPHERLPLDATPTERVKIMPGMNHVKVTKELAGVLLRVTEQYRGHLQGYGKESDIDMHAAQRVIDITASDHALRRWRSVENRQPVIEMLDRAIGA